MRSLSWAWPQVLLLVISHTEAEQGTQEVDTTGSVEDSYTLVVNAFRRDNLLERGLLHWAACTEPEQIRVIWNDVQRPLPDFLKSLVKRDHRLVVDTPNTSNLTNRFLPEAFLTNAVFSVDDDVTYSCGEVKDAFRIWQQNPEKLVGFHGRHIMANGLYTAEGPNTVFITKGGFANRSFYSLYFAEEYKDLREAVNDARTGEDLLMSFLHASNFNNSESVIEIPPYSYINMEENTPRSLRNQTGSRRQGLVKRFISYFGLPFQAAIVLPSLQSSSLGTAKTISSH
mmetsp:Transcript_856/g.1682  ORF Transcript_856/g.1682 Transcript_856/m.1682 type:complete len:285 (+) Transcript_856:58-912(+)